MQEKALGSPAIARALVTTSRHSVTWSWSMSAPIFVSIWPEIVKVGWVCGVHGRLQCNSPVSRRLRPPFGRPGSLYGAEAQCREVRRVMIRVPQVASAAKRASAASSPGTICGTTLDIVRMVMGSFNRVSSSSMACIVLPPIPTASMQKVSPLLFSSSGGDPSRLSIGGDSGHCPCHNTVSLVGVGGRSQQHRCQRKPSLVVTTSCPANSPWHRRHRGLVSSLTPVNRPRRIAAASAMAYASEASACIHGQEMRNDGICCLLMAMCGVIINSGSHASEKSWKHDIGGRLLGSPMSGAGFI